MIGVRSACIRLTIFANFLFARNPAYILFLIVSYLTSPSALAQGTNATVTNNAAPNATVSTNANGGTQINQQLNNIYDTSFGFGPGIICRTPQIVLNGGAGQTASNLDVYPAFTGNRQSAGNFTGSISFAMPIGSSIISDCQKYAAQIASDRVISSELSLIRACAQLEKEKLVIDPSKYPSLAKCLPTRSAGKISSAIAPALPLVPSTQPPNIPAPAENSSYQRFNP
jgi:hypothetical protein